MAESLLGVPAIRQILARLNKNEAEEKELINKIERNCRKFDHSSKGALRPDEYYNVLKLQNGIDISKDEVKAILGPLSANKEGAIKIEDFLHKDIHSDYAFKVLDKNNDGYISKGELKLAKKNVTIGEIDKCIKENDSDKDGRLNETEFQKSK